MIRILLSNELGKRRWSQADLARKTRIRVSTIGDYYNGLTDRDLICKALDCDLTDLLVYYPDEDTPVKSRSGAPLREQTPKE
ncbi:MAG: helix-turn-helix transcriptional regulator [Oscillospiraceae bacterium]|nr:helix-turn-helix transcriptional regulator [Oscillospiraceae bacterium]